MNLNLTLIGQTIAFFVRCTVHNEGYMANDNRCHEGAPGSDSGWFEGL